MRTIGASLLLIAVLLGSASAQTYPGGSSGGSSSLVVGATAITGGTANGLLYSDGTYLQSDANVVVSTASSSVGNITIKGGGATVPQMTFAPNSGVAMSIGMANSGSELVVFTGSSPTLGIENGVIFQNSGAIQWGSGSGVSGSNDVNITRNTTGVIQIGTTAVNASGSLLLTNITPSGVITNAAITTDSGQTATATVCEDTTSHQYYFGSGTGGICKGTSGRQFKRDIRDLADLGLADVIALAPKRYFNRPGIGLDSAREQVGLIADEVKQHLPACADDNTVDYLCVSVVVLNAIKTLAAEIEILKSKVR
jgi:hypothetical protein